MYLQRIIIGLLFILVIIGVFVSELYLQTSYLSKIIVGILIIFSLIECYNILEKANYKSYKKLGIIGSLIGLFFLIFLKDEIIKENINNLYNTFFIIGIIIYSLKEKDIKISLNKTITTIFGFIYVYYLLKYLLFIRDLGGNKEGIIFLLSSVLIVKSMDIGGYLVGYLIGKHRISPHISPKKSLEGLIGGIIFCYLTLIILISLFNPIKKIFPLESMIIFPFFIGIVSLISDLFESIIKRCAKQKDSNTLIPQFGGILDITDSLIITAPIIYYYIKIFI